MRVWTSLLLVLQTSHAFCPHECRCDDYELKVTCPPEAKLDLVPNTLNPRILGLSVFGTKSSLASGGQLTSSFRSSHSHSWGQKAFEDPKIRSKEKRNLSLDAMIFVFFSSSV